MTLNHFNHCPAEEAVALLLGCCHCRRWAEAVVDDRPFENREALMDAARGRWREMGEEQWLEAFQGHARIGDLSKLRDKFSRASAEQGQVREADEQVLEDLLRLNRDYEARHGFIFIVCATGKSAEQMRDLLRERLPRSREEELTRAAMEQGRITELRLNTIFQTD